MKRVQAACLCQTLHFMAKENMPYDYTSKTVRYEIERYKKSLARSGVKFKITDELEQPDGSVIIKIIKQHNSCPVGNYLK